MSQVKIIDSYKVCKRICDQLGYKIESDAVVIGEAFSLLKNNHLNGMYVSSFDSIFLLEQFLRGLELGVSDDSQD